MQGMAALFRDLGLKITRSYSNALISPSPLPFGTVSQGVMEYPFIVTDHLALQASKTVKMGDSFLYLPFQPIFTEYHGKLDI